MQNPILGALRASCLVALLAALSMGTVAHGFSLFEPCGVADTVEEIFQQTGRWSSISGLSDGIQVGVQPGFATLLGATPSEVIHYQQVVVDAFAAWESPVLQFDIAFDASGVEEGPEFGFEIDVFAVPGSHPVFEGTPYFGYAKWLSDGSADRPLTNGQSFDGCVISGADIYVNITNALAFAEAYELSWEQRLVVARRVLMHELGHALGLGHPNSNNPEGVETNYDTDNDPLNAMVIDSADPFRDLIVSGNRDDTAVMSNRPCGEPLVDLCPALFPTSLANDDLGGRDALYPLPEPFTALEIDIRPGSDPNSVNPLSPGVIAVAILTTEDFDALTVDEGSVRFGPDEAEKAHKRAHVKDVDGDGDLDLVLHFRTRETGIAAGDTEACLISETYDGVPIEGCDAVRTVPPN